MLSKKKSKEKKSKIITRIPQPNKKILKNSFVIFPDGRNWWGFDLRVWRLHMGHYNGALGHFCVCSAQS